MPATPTLFVLFGATGDLSRRKLLPALYDLWFEDSLPPKFRLIAVGRRAMDTQGFAQELSNHPTHPFKQHLDFLSPTYLHLNFDKAGGFDPLWETLSNYAGYQIVYYMAVGPEVLKMCIDRFKDPSAAAKMRGRSAVIVAEKPFGSSLSESREFNHELGDLFTYKYVYRNDHYLKKDTVQAIGELIETDVHISHLLNNQMLKEISLVVSEPEDLGDRASYFDSRGMLVDWFQSHMLQLISTLCADRRMDNFHTAKQEFIESLEPIKDSVLRAQYDGYQSLPDVKEQSTTETFLGVQMTSDLPSWRGVTFKFIAGKAMAKKEVYFKLTMKEKHHKFGDYVKLLIDPPGGNPMIQPTFRDEFEETILDSINLREDKFVSAPEVEAQWATTHKVEAMLASTPLQTYAKGTSYMDFCDVHRLWCQD